ncbi:ornithine carbamoyltransferase 1 [Micropruina glycogenica]|uniref:Ornithine carbamoyltransferase n=1 Tax=Micropruina glycogenica TaxID=75385 RepID=A0A2N9JIU0_9ACTN|nr:ornithine carbamoyltransferase 1 [Micropruina glycogenica]
MNLRNRHFLKELDYTTAEWKHLLGLSAQLKQARRDRAEHKRLDGLTLALIFEKPSTRTRSSFEVAAYHQGANVSYFDETGAHMGHKESIADTARVLSRFYDGIQYRGSRQSIVETLAAHSSVPVWNGLTDEWHPTQSLCDMFTMRESSGLDDRDISFAYVGDARFNQGRSLLIAGAMMGMDVRIVAPAALQPDPDLVAVARRIGAGTGARVTITEDVSAVRAVDFVHTDIWVSMGEPKQVWAERIDLLTPYRVTTELLERTENPDVKFMHCLPSYHDLDTTVSQQILAETGKEVFEVTEEVFESPASLVFEQAENRLHTIKAILVATLAG